MAKTLELQFLTEFGQSQNLTVDAPKGPIDEAEVKAAMEAIIASNAFRSSKGRLANIKGARVIERNVTEYEI
ncbi:hypothetical protein J27TS8_17060 [Robertmurraya siralis]|uniref:DUF2922 domain-containing protein n=1 Tax=Robertmurraya siralis TaxID=77777 RepID=A0A920BT75_9BACI|nr:DUF2922 domain-containing protein [Robertmurraya siralis]PAE21546.1 hypothetical protein CHH80_06515 [Bacillus sp. 7504-2]GIN61713.1 hypothetical protein J27TS8_17060 [Robertmurraya siralis]